MQVSQSSLINDNHVIDLYYSQSFYVINTCQKAGISIVDTQDCSVQSKLASLILANNKQKKAYRAVKQIFCNSSPETSPISIEWLQCQY